MRHGGDAELGACGASDSAPRLERPTQPLDGGTMMLTALASPYPNSAATKVASCSPLGSHDLSDAQASY